MKTKKVGKKDAASRSRDLVARYACGNVSLQIKRYVTAAEKEERKRRVLAAKFL